MVRSAVKSRLTSSSDQNLLKDAKKMLAVFTSTTELAKQLFQYYHVDVSQESPHSVSLANL